MIREVDGGNGYAGQSTQRVHFGLGADAQIASVHIRWPSGAMQDLNVPADRLATVTEGVSTASK